MSQNNNVRRFPFTDEHTYAFPTTCSPSRATGKRVPRLRTPTSHRPTSAVDNARVRKRKEREVEGDREEDGGDLSQYTMQDLVRAVGAKATKAPISRAEAAQAERAKSKPSGHLSLANVVPRPDDPADYATHVDDFPTRKSSDKFERRNLAILPLQSASAPADVTVPRVEVPRNDPFVFGKECNPAQSGRCTRRKYNKGKAPLTADPSLTYISIDKNSPRYDTKTDDLEFKYAHAMAGGFCFILDEFMTKDREGDERPIFPERFEPPTNAQAPSWCKATRCPVCTQTFERSPKTFRSVVRRHMREQHQLQLRHENDNYVGKRCRGGKREWAIVFALCEDEQLPRARPETRHEVKVSRRLCSFCAKMNSRLGLDQQRGTK